jgi:hypothetical protein
LFAAILDLRNCLSRGFKAEIVREWNADCDHPLYNIPKEVTDFRKWTGNGASMYTRQEIEDSNIYSDFEKHLMLNYHTLFGTQESVDHYYKTGELSKGNILGVGKCHLVKVTDLVDFLIKLGDPTDKTRIDIFTKQYITQETAWSNQFYDNVKLINPNGREKRVFKHKLWAVNVLGRHNDQAVQPPIPKHVNVLLHIINVLVIPFKYIPTRSVLKMTKYTLITYRVGGVTNGYSVQFQVPKKFGF